MARRRSTTNSPDAQASEFWNSASMSRRVQDMAHWRGVGRRRSDKAWRGIGWHHLRLFHDFRSDHDVRDGPMESMLELGPGGGSNIVAFADLFEEITAVDISISTLEECARQIEVDHPGYPFSTFPIGIDDPEAMIGLGPFDFFLCTAVVQHMPTAAWAERAMRIAAGEMRSVGQALVQFRTKTGAAKRHENHDQPYERNVARWLMFEPEDFIELLDRAGWHVLQCTGDGKSGYMYTYLEVK